MTAAKESATLRIWRPFEREALELRLGTSIRHSYPRHWHEELFVSAITAGVSSLCCRGSSQWAAPGSLIMVAPGEVHAHHDCGGGRSFRSIHAPVSYVEEVGRCVIPDADAFPALKTGVIEDARLFAAFLRVHRALEENLNRLQRESLLLRFFAALFRQYGNRLRPASTRRARRSVRRAVEFLNDHYNRAVSLRELAAISNLSPYHFHREFCRHTGMPPHAYQVQLRVLRARRLLQRQWPIAHVSSLTGFADQSHFTRHFKRVLGVTPAQYAR